MSAMGKKSLQRFRTVYQRPLELLSDWVPPTDGKTEDQRGFLKKALSDHSVLLRVDDKTLTEVVNAFSALTYPKGHQIFAEGEVGDYCYVIEEGTVMIKKGDKEDKCVGPGTCFGDVALFYDTPRTYCAICKTDFKGWRLHQHTVRKLKTRNAVMHKKEAQKLVDNCEPFKNWSKRYRRVIADGLERKVFEKDQILVRKGVPCDAIYFLQQGTIKAFGISVGESRYEDVTAKPGDCFGQSLIVDSDPWAGTATAVTDGVVYGLSKDRFVQMLSDFNVDEILDLSNEQMQLQAIPIFANSDLTPSELERLQQVTRTRTFRKGHVIWKQGEIVDRPALYLVRVGKVAIRNRHGGTLQMLDKRTYFGHDMLFPAGDDSQIVAKHDVVVIEDAALAELTLRTIENVIIDLDRLGNSPIKRAKMDHTIALNSLEKDKILKDGIFSQTWAVHDENAMYALKIRHKRLLIGSGQVECAVNEKNILETIHHPFLAALVNKYQDDTSIYLLIEFVKGQQLDEIVDCGLPENEALFYASCVLEGMSYLHRRDIVHRDVKLENIVLGSDGYCVLVDLGLSKYVRDDKTFTLCGTPTAMAPEVLLGEGHNQGSDYWSLGILIFEMVAGYTPFYEAGMSQVDLFNRIVSARFQISPSDEMSEEIQDLLKAILVPNPSFRLGCFSRGDLDVRDHSWFQEMDFDKLVRKELQPPRIVTEKETNRTASPTLVKQDTDLLNLEPLSNEEQQLFIGF